MTDMTETITVYENYFNTTSLYSDFRNDFKPSGFMAYVSFCTSHKATVKRMKNKSKRGK